MNGKLFLSHIIIFGISIFIFTNAYGYLENEKIEYVYSIFHFGIILLLYAYSGYYFSKKKEFRLKDYHIVTTIGILFWLIAFMKSPNSLNYKSGNGGIWLFYRIYIAGLETPLNFNKSYNLIRNVNIIVALLLFYSIIPSLLQALGGYLRKNNNVKMKKLNEKDANANGNKTAV